MADTKHPNLIELLDKTAENLADKLENDERSQEQLFKDLSVALKKPFGS